MFESGDRGEGGGLAASPQSTSQITGQIQLVKSQVTSWAAARGVLTSQISAMHGQWPVRQASGQGSSLPAPAGPLEALVLHIRLLLQFLLRFRLFLFPHTAGRNHEPGCKSVCSCKLELNASIQGTLLPCNPYVLRRKCCSAVSAPSFRPIKNLPKSRKIDKP